MNTLDATRFRIGTIDRSKCFLPEHLCPVAHTASYKHFSSSVRLRYNQLFASCYHEHFIFLESLLAGPILPALLRRFAGDPIALRLQRFQDEERLHTSWFHQLHQACEPELYRDNHYYFVGAPPFAIRLFESLARLPHRFPFVLWLAMIIEERTIPASRDILRESYRLEPHFVALHRAHAADEAGHVSCDGEIISRLWPQLNPALKICNRWLFVTLLKEFFRVPKRAGWKVVQQLARERPEVVPLLPNLRRDLHRLADNNQYLQTLYSRAREPRTFALADRFQEFRKLEERLNPNPIRTAV